MIGKVGGCPPERKKEGRNYFSESKYADVISSIDNLPLEFEGVLSQWIAFEFHDLETLQRVQSSMHSRRWKIPNKRGCDIQTRSEKLEDGSCKLWVRKYLNWICRPRYEEMTIDGLKKLYERGQLIEINSHRERCRQCVRGEFCSTLQELENLKLENIR